MSGYLFSKILVRVNDF